MSKKICPGSGKIPVLAEDPENQLTFIVPCSCCGRQWRRGAGFPNMPIVRHYRQEVLVEEKLMQFRSILMLSADSSEQLRACDVDRVMDAAQDQKCLEEFRQWILTQELQDRTRAAITAFEL